MAEVVALGEALIDFTPAGQSETGNPIYERNPGGAPANVLAQLARLGVDTAFIGKVGNDLFGCVIQDVLRKAGVNTESLILTSRYNTTLAFVQLDQNGDRSFCFVRNQGADKMLEQSEVNFSILDDAKLFHFGGVSLTEEPSRSTTFAAAAEAHKRGLMVSYDPNYRKPLWHEKATGILKEGLKFADILKVSDEECILLSGKDNLAEGSEWLSKEYNIGLVLVTLGSKGAAFRFGKHYEVQPTFYVRTIDTTGAGDSFLGSIIYCILRSGKCMKSLTLDDVQSFVRFANAAGALVTAKKGAILSMPSLSQIQTLLL